MLGVDMGTIKLVYSRSNGLASVLIRLGAWWGPWSHVAIVVGDSVIETRAFSGVQVTGLDDLIARSSRHEIVEIECPNPDAGVFWAASTVGSKYDWGGVLAIPFRERKWQSPIRWYCSEHVEAALIAAGLTRFRDGLKGISPSQSYFVK